jgi:hypothetical protein
MKECKSCVRCLFLYTKDDGYSNYTVTDTQLLCVLGKNKKLPERVPDTWGPKPWVGMDGNPWEDRFHATKDGRCENYQERPLEFERVELDVEEERLLDEESAKAAFLQGDVMPLLVRKHQLGEPL